MSEVNTGIPIFHLLLFAGGAIITITLLARLKIKERQRIQKHDEFGDSDE